MPILDRAMGTTIDNSTFTDVAGDQTTSYTTNNFAGTVYFLRHHVDAALDNPPLMHHSDDRFTHLPLEQVQIEVLIIDGNVTPVAIKLCYLHFDVYDSLSTCNSETNLWQFLRYRDGSREICLPFASSCCSLRF